MSKDGDRIVASEQHRHRIRFVRVNGDTGLTEYDVARAVHRLKMPLSPPLLTRFLSSPANP